MKRLLRNLFSVKNEYKHKIIKFFGIKIKLKLKVPVERVVLEHLETHVVDYCNLNCKGCSHFCNLAPKTKLSLNSFKEDLEELSNKFIIKRFFILGGEPLLHPQIEDLIKITRYYLSETDIFIISNGILLKFMPKSFFMICKNNNIHFSFSKYPININWDENCSILNKFGIPYILHDIDKFYAFHNPKGNSIPEDSFKACKNHFQWCYTLRNGKVFTCPKSCFIDFYNNYYKENIPKPKGMDIYSNDAETIKTYLEKPNETCRFCSNVFECYKYDWAPSAKNKNEWNDINIKQNC